jgi:hypothetical protein
MGIIKELDPLFKEYIIQQIKMLANLHKRSKDGQARPEYTAP